MNGSGPVGRRALVGVAVGTALVSAGGTYALAAKGPAAITGTGTSTEGPCMVGYDTRSATLTPPDELLVDNPVAGTVTLRKPCAGAVIAEFSSEVETGSGFVTLSLWATCTGSAGHVEDPCTVGDQVVARPGYTYLFEGDSSVTTTSTHSVQMVFPAVPRGRWRFDAVPGGSDATLHARTFVVTAYPGG
jgi:hypothetical protein